MKINKHIEIVRTDLTTLGSMSNASALRVQAELSKHYIDVGISVVNSFVDLEVVVRSNPDLVFLGMKRMEAGKRETKSYTEVWMADYFEQHSIRYTGSRASAIKLDYDKAQAKAIVAKAGMPTPAYFTATPDQYESAAQLPLKFPLFVKPVSKGGGKGIDDDSVVRSFAKYEAKVASIYTEYGTESLVETYLEGREFTVAILDTFVPGTPLVMPIEIITEENKRGDRILGSKVKTDDHELVVTVNNRVLNDTLCQLAVNAYQILGGRDLGRIDIRMDSGGVAHFLEANFAPAPGSRYFAGAGRITKDMDYETMLLKIVGVALARPLVKHGSDTPQDIAETIIKPVIGTPL